MLVLSGSLPRSGKARRLLMGLYAKDHGKILFRSFTCNHRPHLIGCSNREGSQKRRHGRDIGGEVCKYDTKGRSPESADKNRNKGIPLKKRKYHHLYLLI